MVRSLTLLSIILLSFAGSCTSRGESELLKALSLAVKEKKLSRQKMDNIIGEYELLRENEKNKAREYAAQVVSAIKLGGDSSHIDVVRKQMKVQLKKI